MKFRHSSAGCSQSDLVPTQRAGPQEREPVVRAIRGKGRRVQRIHANPAV